MNENIPLLEFDETEKAILNPTDVVKPGPVPECAVLCFFNDEIQKLNQQGKLRQIKKLKSEMGSHLVFSLQVGENDVVLFHPGVGAPLAAAMFEELIALGCRKFVACGGAGTLDSDLPMGHLLLPTTAVRDEGTSYHYLPPGPEVAASPAALAAVEKTLQAHNLEYQRTKTWTTDAVYRETPEKIARRKSQGCLAVEMEAAALFAVAQFRKVEIAQILYAGDDVGGTRWQSRGWVKHREIRQKLILLAAEACLSI